MNLSRLPDERAGPVTATFPEGAHRARTTQFEPSIQGLRGLAALSVLLVHLYDMPMLAGFLPAVPSWLNATVGTFGRGVEVFFMISGYLIPASLVRHKLISKFFYDRCLRILPVFVTFHLILFAIGPLVGYKFFKDIDALNYLKIFFANLFFLPDILNLPLGQQNAWTLTYEWAFYIWFAVAFYFASRSRPITALVVVAGCAAVFYFPITAYFLIGLVLGAIELRIRAQGLPGLIFSVACLALMYAMMEYVHPFAGLIPAFFLFSTVLNPDSAIAQLLSKTAPQFVGKISYSLYLVHPFALYPLQVIGSKLVAHGYSPWAVWPIFVIVGLPLSFVASTITYELIEVRMRHAVAALLGDSKRRSLAEARND
ncbi:acyltransferase [Bradyrhizobium arachidis]|uniref:acyltransferase family protein n=1 Tax=Bradyrhizobium TaxID=374 RepID=UPI002163E7BE|nr:MULTISPECIES: acyltransferase [Bradyrhizobium]MDN4988160.1 acyltransferase [Bradyrhizobium sp. WYCCWR 13022]UVO35415.1 acyltransferase [Bradyrhizobium arachidis]